MAYDAYMNPLIEHTDYEKCGNCWRQTIQGQVAKEFHEAGKAFDFIVFFDEVEKRWQETSLFKEVQGLLKSGLTIDEAQAIMEAKGIEI